MPPHSKLHKLKKPPLPPIAEPTPAPVQRRLVLPSSFYPQKNQPTRCRFLFTTVLILLISLAVAAALFYLWFTPKLPVFKLRPVQFAGFTVTPASDGLTYLRTGASVWVEVKNPNSKLDVYYGGSQMDITADDGDVEMGSASLPEFTQTTRNVTLLRFVTTTTLLPVDEGTGERLNAAVKTGEVKLTVEVKTEIGFGFGNFRTVKWPVDVACGGVSVNKVKNVGPLKCRVNWFIW